MLAINIYCRMSVKMWIDEYLYSFYSFSFKIAFNINKAINPINVNLSLLLQSMLKNNESGWWRELLLKVESSIL